MGVPIGGPKADPLGQSKADPLGRLMRRPLLRRAVRGQRIGEFGTASRGLKGLAWGHLILAMATAGANPAENSGSRFRRPKRFRSIRRNCFEFNIRDADRPPVVGL